MSVPPVVTDEQLRKLREWRALPKHKRRRSLVGMAAMLGLTVCTAKRAAYGMGYYARVQP